MSKIEKLFDKRTVSRNIQKKLVGDKDYDQYLKELPDVTDKSVPMFNDEEPAEQ